MIKAVFFDIDGTLVPFGSHSIPDNTRDALRQLRANGIKVFIATGRHPAWIDNLGDECFDGYVTTNGALCLAADRRTEIYRREIDRGDLERLIPFSRSHSEMPFVVVPADGRIFTTGVNANFTQASKLLNIPPVPLRPVEDVLDVPVVQMMVFASGNETEASGLFRDVLRGCDATSWCTLFADIVPHGSDKSIGIDHVIEWFGISLDETMAFGDGDNDIGMLKHVACGVAMGNAADSVKGVADYVTLPVDCDGIGEALRHFRLI